MIQQSQIGRSKTEEAEIKARDAEIWAARDRREAALKEVMRRCFVTANGVEPRASQIDGLIRLCRQVKLALSSPEHWDWTKRDDMPNIRCKDHRLSSGANYYHILVGPRGSGKSTVLRALKLLYDNNPKVEVLTGTTTADYLAEWHTYPDKKGKVLIFPVLDSCLDPHGATIPFRTTICEASGNNGFIEAFSVSEGYDLVSSTCHSWVRRATELHRRHLSDERLPSLISQYPRLDNETASLMLTLSLGSDYILKKLIAYWISCPAAKTANFIIQAIGYWTVEAYQHSKYIPNETFYHLLEGLGLTVTVDLINGVINPLNKNRLDFDTSSPRENEFTAGLVTARKSWLEKLPEVVYQQFIRFIQGLNPTSTTNVLVAVRIPKERLGAVAATLQKQDATHDEGNYPFPMPHKHSFLAAEPGDDSSGILLTNLEAASEDRKARLPVSHRLTHTTYSVEGARRSSAIKYRYIKYLKDRPLTSDTVDLLFLTGDHNLTPNHLLAAAAFAQMVANIPDIPPEQISII